MYDLSDMSSKTNSLEGVKEKYKKAVIENYKYVRENRVQIGENGRYDDRFANLRTAFSQKQSDECIDSSLPSNERWGLVSRKNLFGLEAEILPTEYMEQGKPVKGKTFFLKGCSGRFQMTKFSYSIFPNHINITDILERSEEEQYAEIEEFYNMTNKEFFEKYGINANRKDQINLVANCVILDSLLKGKYSELQEVFCWNPGGVNEIVIELSDGTKITAQDTDKNVKNKSGIIIEKDGKKAELHFNAISLGEKSSDRLTNINNLEVEDVTYAGDEELIKKLQQAMQEQFKSQQPQQTQTQDNTTVSQHESWYDKYNEMVIKLLDKAGVGSYDENYELDGLTIALINEGQTVVVKSDTLGVNFQIDGEKCSFYDSDNLVKIDYHSKEENKSSPIEEDLSHLEQIEPNNKEIIERIKEFAKKLEELARDEIQNGEINPEELIQSDNDLLIASVINGGVTTSDVQTLQQRLINVAEKSNGKTTLDENQIS